MEFGLSPIPGFLFLCPFLRFGSARTQFPAAPNFFYFQPLLFRGVCCPAVFFRTALFPSELFFFLLGCCFLLRCPVPCCLFPLPSFLASFPVRPLPACPLPARPLSSRPLSSRPLSRTPFFRAFFSRLLSRALSFPRASSRAPLPARLFPRASFCTPSFRASRTFLPRLHSSRLEPSPQLEHSPTGTSAERNGSGWNGSKWGSNVCAIVFGASTGPSRAVYVTKLLNIFRILLKYLHNSKRPRIFAVKF